MSGSSEPGWRVDRTINTIRIAASRGECVTYGQIAAVNGMVWSAKIRSECSRHLEAVCEAVLPTAQALISAVVVNESNRTTMKLAPFALKGFVRCAERLGRPVTVDPEAFLRREQEATFGWARRTKT